ncbi:MAG: hypothetical protein HPY85_10680 [Anaerolineae bacterium]|nr:hypothetical protein [Anaerolineae bacterium]
MSEIDSHKIILEDGTEISVYALTHGSNFQPEHLAGILANVYNQYGMGDFNLRLAKALLEHHRTLQQSVVRAFVAVMVNISKLCAAMPCPTDPRNENAIKFCSRLERLIEEEEIYFPMI